MSAPAEPSSTTTSGTETPPSRINWSAVIQEFWTILVAPFFAWGIWVALGIFFNIPIVGLGLVVAVISLGAVIYMDCYLWYQYENSNLVTNYSRGFVDLFMAILSILFIGFTPIITNLGPPKPTGFYSLFTSYMAFITFIAFGRALSIGFASSVEVRTDYKPTMFDMMMRPYQPRVGKNA